MKKFNAHNVPNNLISMYVLTNFVQEEDDVSTRVNNMLQNEIYNFHHTIIILHLASLYKNKMYLLTNL